MRFSENATVVVVHGAWADGSSWQAIVRSSLKDVRGIGAAMTFRPRSSSGRTPDADGFIWMPDEGFANAFAQNATDEQISLSKVVQRPISVKCIQESAPAPAWKSKPAWYLVAEEDRMINPKTQRFMAERMKATVRSFAVDHTPLLTAPDKVVDVILEAAKATLS
jgi:pimeloyl-ACP methyl ester carboxylesterase